MTAVTEAVGRYRAAGWKTVPVHRPGAGPGACTCGRPDCDKPGKHLDPRHWPGGTADAAAFEGRNVGVLLGPDSGNLADVDLDCAEARRAAPHLLPATPATFGRGAAVTHHLYVLVDGAAAFARLTDPVLPGAGATVVELRWPNADDDTGVPKAAQTVFPPSLHHTGDTLAWARDGAPAAVPGADLAAAVRRVAAAVLVARYARPKERHALVLLLANLGVRAGWADDDTVVRFAAAVFAAKGDEAMLDRVRRGEGANAVTDARKRLKAGKPMTGLPALAKMLDPALPTADADAVVARVRDWLGLPDAAAPAAAGDDPWPDPIPLSRPVAVPPFPAEVLPGWVRDWAAAVATEKQVPVDLPALLALGLVGAGLARKVVARPRPGFAEPVNLFVMPVLPPGERKSQTLAAALAPVRDLERELRDAARPAVAAAESDFRVAEARVKGLEAKLVKAEDPDQKGRLREQLAAARDELLKVEVPPMPLLYTEDDTPDALKAEVIRQGGRLTVASTEAKCLENITLYSDRPNFDVYLKGHAGDELKTGRVSRGRAAVADPALSCLLAPQPAVLEGLAASAALKGRGFLARWAYALPESRVGRRAVGAPAVPGAVQATYHRLLRAVWETGYGVDPETGAPAARVLGFDPGADAAFRAFEAEVEPLLAPGGALGGLAGWGNKLCGLCARLAAGLHVADALGDGRGWASPIGAGAVTRAARLCRGYLVPHALAAFGLMGADAKLAAARRVWRWVAGNRPAEFTKRDCFNALRAHFETVDQLQPALDLLERHFLIRAKVSPERAGRGRRPSPVYEVNPGADGDGGGDGGPAAPGPAGPNSAYCARGLDSSPAAAAGGATNSAYCARGFDPPPLAAPDDVSNSAYCARTPEGGAGTPVGSRAAPGAQDDLGPGPHNPQNSEAADPPAPRVGRKLAHNTRNSIAAGPGEPGWGQEPAHNTQNSADTGAAVWGVMPAHNPQNSTGSLWPGAAAELVTAPAALAAVAAAIAAAGGLVGLDTETTGLDHSRDRARLLQLATARGTFLIDLFAFADPAAALAPVFEALATTGVVGHNLGFDTPFLMRLGFTPGRVIDTMLASQVLHAGDMATRHGLRDVAARHLGLTLDKELQQADWAGDLTPDRLRYAALDAEVPLRAWPELATELEAARL
ncbi:DUF3987 domain-containing protein, partial [bacterium]|nr:DUF3987 domain-containing protein [bacterium]